MSLVLVATSLASWAPRFSYGFSSSTSRATVTPSLVMVGAPHFLSITTLRPRGPSVTLTVSASLSTPRSSARRASSSNSRILGIYYLNLRLDRVLSQHACPCSQAPAAGPPADSRTPRRQGPRVTTFR